MAQHDGRFGWVCRLARLGLVAAVTILALAAIGTLLLIFTTEPYELAVLLRLPEWMVIPALGLCVLGQGALALMCFVAYGLVRIFAACEENVYALSGHLQSTEALLSDIAANAKNALGLASLSDKAKGLIYRERELEAMREAIHDDMIRQNYDSAETMIDQIEQEFGHPEEAQRLRQEVSESRKATLDEKIDAAIGRIQSLLDTHDWNRALRESHRIMRLFPDIEKVSSLPRRVARAQAKHKRQLLQEYGEAVRKNDIDRGVELLKELDLYLTPQEAAALQESARGVFKARLHQLGVQFAISVNEQQWAEAIAAGREIIREFPNSRFAQEVRQKMPLLRAKINAKG